MFEPFYTTKPAGGALGLGLSQVFRFARQAHGEARIASRPGQGTTVTLRLPRDLTASMATPGETFPLSPPLPVAAPRRRIKRANACGAVLSDIASSASLGTDRAS